MRNVKDIPVPLQKLSEADQRMLTSYAGVIFLDFSDDRRALKIKELFDIPSDYQQKSSSVSMTELENDRVDYISYEDLILKLGNDYTINGIQTLKIDGVYVKEYRVSSKSSTIFVYTFKHWGHTYNIGISSNNVLFWNAESRSNPIYQIISTFR